MLCVLAKRFRLALRHNPSNVALSSSLLLETCDFRQASFATRDAMSLVPSIWIYACKRADRLDVNFLSLLMMRNVCSSCVNVWFIDANCEICCGPKSELEHAADRYDDGVGVSKHTFGSSPCVCLLWWGHMFANRWWERNKTFTIKTANCRPTKLLATYATCTLKNRKAFMASFGTTGLITNRIYYHASKHHIIILRRRMDLQLLVRHVV